MQDLTKITTPWGLLDEETKAALKAHKGPIEIWDRGWDDLLDPSFDEITYVYRAKPQPVRGEIVMFGAADNCFTNIQYDWMPHRLTLPTIDGALIAGEYRDDAGNVIKLEVL